MAGERQTEITRAIGDLGPAFRHVERLKAGQLPLSPAVLQEIAASLERCVVRLAWLDGQVDTASYMRPVSELP